MGGKPLLVKNGVARYTTPWADPPMMDHNPCYQWCGRFWRPALMMGTDGWGSMLITGAARLGCVRMAVDSNAAPARRAGCDRL